MCLFFPFLAGLHKYYWLDLHGKNGKMGIGSTKIPFNFKSDPDHNLDTKIERFSHLGIIELFLKIIRDFVELCTL